MKKTVVLILIIAAGIPVRAQKQPSTLQHTSFKNIPGYNTGKATGADTRLIATAKYIYTIISLEPFDSSSIKYSGNNGYDYATQNWKYDTMHRYGFNGSTWQYIDRVSQVISGNRIFLNYTQISSAGNWTDNERNTYTYTDGLLTTQTTEINSGGTLRNDLRVTNTYNADKQIVQSTYEGWNVPGNQWINANRSITHYNSSKQPDTILWQQWNGTLWEDQSRTLNIYTGGILTTILHQGKTGSMWQDATRNMYTNDAAGHHLVDELENWSQPSQSWIKVFRETNTYTGDDLATTTHAEWTGSNFADRYRYIFTYNTDHHMLSEETQSWDIFTNQWAHKYGADHLTHYYYEPYTNDVMEVTGNMAGMQVYPVPAVGQLNIALTLRQAQPVTISIVDLTGKIVKSFTSQAGTTYRRTIDISGMAPGQYLITVMGTTQQAAKTFSIAQ